MSFLHTVILGIVEGLTEFLPISSTAHIDIARSLLAIPVSEFIKSFEIIIQLGAICAVIVVYGKKILTSACYIRNLCIAFIPTGIIGFLLYKIIKAFLIGNILIAGIMLLLGGIIIIVFERREVRKVVPVSDIAVENLSIKTLLSLGVIQALAVVPGVSRSGAVIIGGRMLGLPKTTITEFSFALAIPTMLAATAYDLLKSGLSFSSSQWGTVALGFIISFLVAFAVIKWFLSYIKKHSFEVFGWYRVIIGSIIILIFIL
ncbi:MAG: undecaprenyl-diphosphate phosphatase [bacterium]